MTEPEDFSPFLPQAEAILGPAKEYLHRDAWHREDHVRSVAKYLLAAYLAGVEAGRAQCMQSKRDRKEDDATT